MEEINDPLQGLPLKIAHHHSLHSGRGDRGQNIRNWWFRIVGIFSSLTLTKDSDTFPALAGLTDQLSRALGGNEPLYGHFMDDFPIHLAWNVVTPAKEVRPPKESVPSWSWAYRRTRVQMPYVGSRDSFHVYPSLISGQIKQSYSLEMRCSIFPGFSDKFANEDFPLTKRHAHDTISSNEITKQESKYILLLFSKNINSWLFLEVYPISLKEKRFSRAGLLDISKKNSAGNLSNADDLLRSCFVSVEDMEINLM
jgi:hypothetical protein